ncbi:PorT family protein [bacterium]|nr:PorT family protein [bacterium]
MKSHIVLWVLLAALNGFAEEAAVEETPAETPAEAPVPTAPPAPVAPETESPVAKESKPADQTSPWFFGIQFGQLRTNNSERGRLEKVAYSGGALVEYRLMDQWFVQTELNYLNKGWKVMGSAPGDDVSLKYFEVPLFLKVKFPWNNVAPSLMAGPWAAYLHSASNTLNGISIDTTSGTKRIEYGIYVGAQLDLALAEDLELGIGARYGWGLTDINLITVQDSVFNRVIHLLAALRFRL